MASLRMLYAVTMTSVFKVKHLKLISLQNFIYLATYVYAKGHPPTRTYIRETRVITIGKICKADLPKELMVVCDY